MFVLMECEANHLRCVMNQFSSGLVRYPFRQRFDTFFLYLLIFPPFEAWSWLQAPVEKFFTGLVENSVENSNDETTTDGQ